MIGVARNVLRNARRSQYRRTNFESTLPEPATAPLLIGRRVGYHPRILEFRETIEDEAE